MLAIEVVFLTGRYVATAHNTRTVGEWPPHPARVFSALVATHHATPQPAVDERVVLEWLEQIGAPHITASDASKRDVVTVYVPVNDVGMTDVDAEAGRLDAARALLAQAVSVSDVKAVKKHQAETKKAEAALSRAIERATSATGTMPKPEYG